MGYVCVIFLFAMYFLPALIAAQRKHHNANAICLLNLFLGWTCIGWIAALIWSAMKPVAQTPPQYVLQCPPQYPQPQSQLPQYTQQQVGPWSQQ